jgi:hypothetical protein
MGPNHRHSGPLPFFQGAALMIPLGSRAPRATATPAPALALSGTTIPCCALGLSILCSGGSLDPSVSSDHRPTIHLPPVIWNGVRAARKPFFLRCCLGAPLLCFDAVTSSWISLLRNLKPRTDNLKLSPSLAPFARSASWRYLSSGVRLLRNLKLKTNNLRLSPEAHQ